MQNSRHRFSQRVPFVLSFSIKMVKGLFARKETEFLRSGSNRLWVRSRVERRRGEEGEGGGGWEGRRERGKKGQKGKRDMKYGYGNADICQEIDNSNKLVAKRSNSLPNGTILPLLPAANRTSTYVGSLFWMRGCMCTRAPAYGVHGVRVHAHTGQTSPLSYTRITTYRYKIYASTWYTVSANWL